MVLDRLYLATSGVQFHFFTVRSPSSQPPLQRSLRRRAIRKPRPDCVVRRKY
jgi:hypothetical protein